MAIVISGVNNNDKITATDGVIDSISGFNLAGIITASSFTGDLTGDVTGNISGNNGVFGDFVNVGSNIQIGQAGILTATTFVGNVTGNINNSTLLLQTGGYERLRIDSSGRVLIGTTSATSLADELVVATSGDCGITIMSGTTHNGRLYFSDSGQEGDGFVDYDHQFGNLKLGTRDITRFTIDSTGGVIIGAGNDSNTMSEFGSNTGGLTIDDAGVANTGLRLSHGNDDTYLIQSSNSNFYISQYGTGNMIFGVGASGNERLRITSDGQIRIDQATSANNGIRMRPSGWNYDFRIGAVSSSGGSIWLGQNYEPTGGTRDSASYGTNYIQFTTGGTIHFGTGATNTNPTARMNISSEGYITKPTNLCLQYTPSGSIDLSSGTLIYATEVYDVGNSNAYNTSNGEFTAPVTGVYRIHYEHFANNGRATTNIEKDTGSGYSVIKLGMRVYSQAAGSNWSSVPTIYYAQLNSGDKIRITRREGTVHLNSPWNHLTIQLVQ